MTQEILILLAVLAIMSAMFLSGRVPVDLGAFLGLMTLAVLDYIPSDRVFSGFSSPAVVTMLSMFIISAAVKRSGLADDAARVVVSVGRGNETITVGLVMLFAALFSSVVNNVAAVAVLLPSVVSVGHRTDIPPSRLLIPLSFAVIIGGTATVIGSTPNILINDLMHTSASVQEFSFFAYLPIGILTLVLCTAFLAVIGRHWLPRRETGKKQMLSSRELSQLYRLHERMFSLKIPEGSSLNGRSLEELGFREVLGVQIVTIYRNGDTLLAPKGSDRLKSGDELIVGGRVKDFEDLLKLHGVEVEAFETKSLKNLQKGISGAYYEIVEGPLVGENLRDLHFRERYDVVVVAIERNQNLIYQDLRSEKLKVGDVLRVIGTTNALNSIALDPGLILQREQLAVENVFHDHLFVILVPENSFLAGVSVKASHLGQRIGISVIGILRGERVLLAPGGREVIRPGDRLLVSGEAEHVERIAQFGEMDVIHEEVETELETPDVAVVEVSLTPRSKAIGSSLIDMDFREKYGMQALAIWRQGHPHRSNIAKKVLELGDAILLQGPRRKVKLLADDPDFVLIADVPRAYSISGRIAALAGLLAVIALSVFKLEPVHVSAFIGALIVVLGGAVSLQDSYREVEWRVLFFVAAIIPIGAALKTTGAADLIASSMLGGVSSLGFYGLLAGILLLSNLFSQFLDASLAVVLIGPIALSTARGAGINPEPLLMATALGASLALPTPFSHKANLLVMGAGAYRTKDYLWVGLACTVICVVVYLSWIPKFFPF